MRISIIAIICIFSLSLHASDDKSMKELFVKYDKIMKQHSVELVDEVFTKKFLDENGGKEEFISKVKELPKVKERKGLGKILRSWKKSKVAKMFFANIADKESKPDEPSRESQFIVVEENGVLKIDGTVSDGH